MLGSIRIIAVLALGTPFAAAAQSPAASPAPAVRRFIAHDAPTIALTHVRVIDGTGAAPREDQTLVLTRGVITSLGSAAAVTVPADATIIDGTGKSVMPGLVMLHEHLFYPSRAGAIWHEQGAPFLRLYLGAGVTTMRTAGSMEPYADLNLKAYVEAGKLPGPAIDVTGPYLTGPGADAPQLVELANGAAASRAVRYWAEQGVTSFKAYMHVTREVLRAAITAAHKRGLKVTGHLCSVTFREAAALGIDNLEHGLFEASDFVAGKTPDRCPGLDVAAPVNVALGVASDSVQSLIRELVHRKVAITSTLPVFETTAAGRPPISEATLAAMSPETRAYVQAVRKALDGMPQSAADRRALEMEMAFERAFVAAGGLLLAGSDPTGYGASIAGFGNWRELELLVEAGFTPLEAITIATRNGAEYLGRLDRIGTLAVGKQADLLLVAGNPASDIRDIAKVELVFRQGVGFDAVKLLGSVKGLVGL